jgi:hypothetical protein
VEATGPSCNAQLTGDADVDLAARYIFAEASNDVTEMFAIGQVGANRYQANQARFGNQNWAKVWANLSIADDRGGSAMYNRADPANLSQLDPAECQKYKDATRAAQHAVDVRSEPVLDPFAFILDGVYWFLGAGAKTPGFRIGATTFYTSDPNQSRRPRRR